MPEQNHEGRIVLVNKISEQLAQLTASVNIDVKNNLSTRNVLAENMLAGLLNRMEGWKLINANRIRSNYPAVDLVDKENRIAVQVTSTNGAEKIKHTLEEFEKNDLGKDYDRLYVVIITTDSPTPSMRSKSIPGIFSGETDIWNTPTLLGKLMDLPIHALEDIHSYLTEELGKVDGSRPYLYLPPDSALGDGFVGRETELDDIRQQVDRGVKPVILSGLGGIGKTVLASRFGRLYPDGEVYFIRFQTSFTATVTGLYGKITPAPIQPPSEKEQLEAVMKLLGRCTERDLLIFDNVDADSGDLSDLMKDEVYKKLRQMKPRMILTTRFDRDRAISIGRIDSENLKEIFRTHGAELTDQQMHNLIEAVNGHTMTVDLMARTLNGKGWRKVTAEDMLRAIRENTLPSEKYRKIATDYNQSEEQAQIYQHLSVVFDLTGVPENGQNVLRCATLLPEGGMEGETFGISLPENQQESLDELLDHGWLSIENDLLRIHPIIRLVCREELKPTDETCGAFLHALSDQYGESTYNHAKYDQIAESFSRATNYLEDEKCDWLNHAGFLWNVLAKPLQTIALYEMFLLSSKGQNCDQESLNCIYNNLGTAYRVIGDYKKALHYQMEVLTICEKVKNDDFYLLATCLNNIGSTYLFMQDYQQALTYRCRALAALEENITLSDENPAYLLIALASAYNNVGTTYGHLGNHPMSLEYKLKALDIFETILSANHPDLARAYNNLGIAYANLADYQKALDYHRKGLDIREKELPYMHPDRAESYNNIGYVYYMLGNLREALDYVLRANQIWNKVMGDNHPELANSCYNVASTYGELGKYDQALVYLKKALLIADKTFTSADTRTKAINALIQKYQKQLQMQENMAKAGFNFDNPFASLIPPKK